MSSTREVRREEYSTNVVRTLQPSRPLSPYSQKSDFDNNLDYILDDLQQSISRPGSSLGQPINNYSSQRDVQYLNPVNTTTVLRERSLSPNASSNKMYKTAKYEYSTASSGSYNNDRSGNFNEINKLDTLLSDLEHERTATLDRNKRTAASNNIGIDSGLLEPGTKVIKTTTTYTSKNPVSRELVFESPDSSVLNRSIRHQSPSYETRTVETTNKRNVSYNDDGVYGKPRRTVSPSPINNTQQQQHYVTETRTRTISPTPVTNTERYITETRTINNNEMVPIPKNVNYNEVVRVENSTGPNALQDMQLSDDILPKPKTKVTTTVRTYTYEIPENEAPINSTVVYNNNTISYPDRDPPKNNAVFYKTERNERSVNYFPNQSPPVQHQPLPNNYQPLSIQEAPPHNTTTIYKYDVTNTTNNGHPQHPTYPNQGNVSPYPSQGNIPPGGVTIYPPNQTTIYKTETINTTNKQFRSPTPTNYYPENGPHSHHPGYPHSGLPHSGPPHNHPNEPSVVVYKQTTTTNTRNLPHSRPEREPLLQPFPVDGPIITEVDGSPPKRVEDLMASFGDTSEIVYSNKKVQIAEKPAPHTVYAVSSSTTNKSSNDDKSLSPSKNVAGPPVYYPPNHELFTSKEAESAAYRAQGGYSRASGKYMYESESKSKSSSKSGAAVVPLCCPLCCAMPCTIM